MGEIWRSEVSRKIFHVVGGSFFPLLFLYLPPDICFAILYGFLGFSFLFDASRLFIPPLNRLLLRHFGGMFKEEERRRPTGSTTLLISSLMVLTFFNLNVAVASLLFLSLGDPFAWIFRRRRIYMGISMFLFCLFLGFFLRTFALPLSIPSVVLGALGAVIGELIPFPDDNLLIPPLSALFMGVLTS